MKTEITTDNKGPLLDTFYYVFYLGGPQNIDLFWDTRTTLGIIGLNQGSQTRTCKHQKNLNFFINIKSFCFFPYTLVFKTEFKKNRCGLEDLTLFLMRTTSHFEFKNPGLKRE